MDFSLSLNLGTSIAYPLFSLLVIVPLWRIFRRVGLMPAWTLLVFLPVVGYLVVGIILATARWPTADDLVAAER